MSMMNAAASAGRRVLPNHWDLIALAAIMAVLTAIARAYHGISAPLPGPNAAAVSLDYWALPYYALRTTLRMFAAHGPFADLHLHLRDAGGEEPRAPKWC